MNDPFEDYEYDLVPENLAGRVEAFDLPIRSGGDDRFLSYLGLYDLLARRLTVVLGEAAEVRLTELHRRITSMEGPLRFALWEGTTEIERLRRVTRITSGESRLKREWLIPKLEGQIQLHRRRIDALTTAFERAG